MEGLPALVLWDLVIEVFSGGKPQETSNEGAATGGIFPPAQISSQAGDHVYDMLKGVDHVPSNVPFSSGAAKLIIFEDNDAVIKMCIKSKASQMRHVARTHKIGLGWLFERLREDPATPCET